MSRITHTEFLTWAQEHAGVFGMTKPEEKQTVLLWEDALVTNCYVLEELRYATRVMAANPPLWRNDHLRIIHETIGKLRKKSAQEESSTWDAIENYESCKNCSGIGWVFVPHYRCVKNDEWVFSPGTRHRPLCTVTCCCDIGRRVYASHTGSKRPMPLDQYEFRNPNWRNQIEEHEAGKNAEREASKYAVAVDRNLGRLVNTLAQSMDARSQAALDEAAATAKHIRRSEDAIQQNLYEDGRVKFSDAERR